jgi:hypothetical protein
MRRCDVDHLDSSQAYWVPAVVAPERNWVGAPGCRKGARYMVSCLTLRASRDEFEPFASQLSCLRWVMLNRAQLNRTLPGARICTVPLNLWLLGLD